MNFGFCLFHLFFYFDFIRTQSFEKPFVIKHKSGLCLEVYDKNFGKGSVVQLNFCKYINSWPQKFYLKHLKDSIHQIAARKNKAIGDNFKVLEIIEKSNIDGARIHLWDLTDQDNQKFFIKRRRDKFYDIIVQHTKKCLEVPKGSRYQILQQNNCTGSDFQAFNITITENNY